MNDKMSRKERANEIFKASGVPKKKPLKQLRVKIFPPNDAPIKVKILRAGNGRCILHGHELNCIEPIVDQVEKAYPFDEFSLVQVGRGDFNIVWRGRKPIQSEEIQVFGKPLGSISTVQVGEQ